MFFIFKLLYQKKQKLSVCNFCIFNPFGLGFVLGMMLWCSSTILLHSITKSVYIQVNILLLMFIFCGKIFPQSHRQ